MDKTSSSIIGTLYIVATPIGNLDDISKRAIHTLNAVDAILAEDTRHSAKLLHALGLAKPLIAHHAHNEGQATQGIIERLLQGQSFALISDAGTPLISDPGYTLVRQARQRGIPVVPIPGPCAFITALSAAGIPCDSFLFLGFLPAKEQARKSKLMDLQSSQHTVILYESTHRIHACLHDIQQIYGDDYQFVLAKELTKTFEHFIHANALAIQQWLSEDKAHGNGEFVLLLPPIPQEDATDEALDLVTLLRSELPLKKAVKLASQWYKTSKNTLYRQALELLEKD